MATPVAAASATLLRQYFMEGFYPTGLRTSADAFTPTGALVKAMLINSAVPMRWYKNSAGALVSTPTEKYLHLEAMWRPLRQQAGSLFSIDRSNSLARCRQFSDSLDMC